MSRTNLARRLAHVTGSVVALAALATSAASAQERSPVQYTRDESATMIQKKVRDQDWIVTYEVASGHVTGNVRSADGSATFLDCDRLGVNDGFARFDCFVADGCGGSPCTSQPWRPAGEVELPEAFFLPDPPGWEFGCCDLGGPCLDVPGPFGHACIASGGTFIPGAGCEVLGPIEDCPSWVPPEFCFEGACR